MPFAQEISYASRLYREKIGSRERMGDGKRNGGVHLAGGA
jgi:hypothetical protein